LEPTDWWDQIKIKRPKIEYKCFVKGQLSEKIMVQTVTGQGPTKLKKIIKTNGLSPHKELNGPG
jgi:hypothetical protein